MHVQNIGQPQASLGWLIAPLVVGAFDEPTYSLMSHPDMMCWMRYRNASIELPFFYLQARAVSIRQEMDQEGCVISGWIVPHGIGQYQSMTARQEKEMSRTRCIWNRFGPCFVGPVWETDLVNRGRIEKPSR